MRLIQFQISELFVNFGTLKNGLKAEGTGDA